MTEEEKAAKAKEEAEEKAKRDAEEKAKREAEAARVARAKREAEEEDEEEDEPKPRRRKRSPVPEPEDYGEDVRELDKRVSRIETAREKRRARTIGTAAAVTAALLFLGAVGLQVVKRLRSTNSEGSEHGTENAGLRWDS